MGRTKNKTMREKVNMFMVLISWPVVVVVFWEVRWPGDFVFCD